MKTMVVLPQKTSLAQKNLGLKINEQKKPDRFFQFACSNCSFLSISVFEKEVEITNHKPLSPEAFF